MTILPVVPPQKLIADYFKNLSYPDIVECKPVLYGKTGDVYLVNFKALGESNTGQELKAYAIIINGVVAGYNENFWEDSDKYRLVLKQHLGMLAMEAAEKEPVPAPSEGARVMSDYVAPPGTVKTETIDAIVVRYEEMIAKIQHESSEHISKSIEHTLKAAERIAELERRLSMVQKAAQGETLIMPVTAPPLTPEQSAVGSALDQSDLEYLEHADEAGGVANHEHAKVVSNLGVPSRFPFIRNGKSLEKFGTNLDYADIEGR